jgi:hypothetical protein
VSRKIGFASVKGASGTSTGALSVSAAAAVQGPVTLVEADPSGGSLLSWCDDLRPAGDLYDAAMSRDPGGLAAIVQRLGDVAVVPSWGRPFRTAQALMRPRVPWDLLFDEVAGTVVVDLGRLYPDAPTPGGAQRDGRHRARLGVGAGTCGGDDGVGWSRRPSRSW